MRVQVRGEDCDLPVLEIQDGPPQRDCQRVRLFARATRRAPEPQMLFAAPAGLHQFRQDALHQNIKHSVLAEEVGLPDRQVAGEDFNLLPGQRRGQQPLHALHVLAKAKLRCGVPNPAPQVRPAFRREVQSHVRRDKLAELRQQQIGEAVGHGAASAASKVCSSSSARKVFRS